MKRIVLLLTMIIMMCMLISCTKDKKDKLDEECSLKPVIYLYPTKEEKVSVSLDFNGILTKTDPVYKEIWNVTAYPDGTIMNNDGKKYPYLFWEGINNFELNMSKGFCISGEKTEEFLREKLSYLGLNEKELAEFLEFWVPYMKDNAYNKISFQTTDYTDNAILTIIPKPDSILRVYMVFQPVDSYEKIEEQQLETFERVGFTVVEWGGSYIK